MAADLDLAGLAEDLGLEEEQIRGLVRTFLDSTEADLVHLEQAYKDRDSDMMRAGAHHIKGAAANLELVSIAEAAKALEEETRGGVVVDPTQRIALIRERLNRIRAEIDSDR